MSKVKTIIFLIITAILAFYSLAFIFTAFLLAIVIIILRVLWIKFKEFINKDNYPSSRSNKKDPKNTIIDVDYEIVEETKIEETKEDDTP